MKHFVLALVIFCACFGGTASGFQSELSVLETRYKEMIANNQKMEAGKIAFLIASKYQNSGDVSSATDYYSKAIKIFTEQKDANRAIESHQILGSLLADANKHDLAISNFNNALQILKTTGEKDRSLKVMIKRGKSLLVLKEYKKAVNGFSGALKIAQETKDEAAMYQCYNYLSVAYEKYGDKAMALEYFKKYNESVDKEQAEHLSEIESKTRKEKAELDKVLEEKEGIIDEKERAIQSIEAERLKLERIKLLKEQEVELLNKDKALQQARLDQKEADLKFDSLLINVAVFGLIVLVVFGVFMVRAYRGKSAINKQLEGQNEEIEAQRKELAFANKNITDSIRYAEKIQKAMLADKAATALHIQDSFVLFRPKDIVSGDFYWFGGGQDEMVAAVIDCTGHGVPGAFMSLIGKSLLNEIVVQKKIHDPAIILEQLHIGVRTLLQQENKVNDDGMDASLCMLKTIESGGKALLYAGAKRPLYIVRDGIIEQIEGDRKAVGGRQKEEKRTFTNKESVLKTGDMIYLTSDGFADQNNPENDKFGSPRLRRLMVEIANFPAKDQLSILENELDKHQNGQPQRDDITLVGLLV